MRLQRISYREWEGKEQEWRIDDLLLGPRNLLVGKNSSGKSRSLSIIGGLANLLCGTAALGSSGNYKCWFDHEGTEFQYELKYEEQQVVFERVRIGNRLLLERSEGGAGKIAFEKVDGGAMLDFQAPPFSLAAFVRRDTVQHSFLEHLAAWAGSVRFYHFANAMAKTRLAAFNSMAPTPDDRDEFAVVGLFREGVRQFPNDFVPSMIADLDALDYPVDEITVGPPVTIKIQTVIPAPEIFCIQVRERGLTAVTDQLGMSDGMFRVVALLTHVNLALLRKSASTILIDDIGEGLDFDRSVRLIELLRQKATDSKMQLVMSTNDRFVMNHVPLDEWTVLQRKSQVVEVKNYTNSKDHFDQFKFTGLSNFSFFEMNADALSTVTLATDEDGDDDEGYDFPNRGKRDV